MYEQSVVTEVSWFQPEPTVSVDLITAADLGSEDQIVDVGGGASTLVDRLLDGGYHNVTVLDLAASALEAAKTRLGQRAQQVHWYTSDLLDWHPQHRYRLWHDRAVFHFLTDPADRDRYRAVMHRALAPGGHLIIGTFAADGPSRCSGLSTARYDPAALAAEFSDFDVERTVREEHRTPAGHTQPFTWLLLASTDR